MFGAEAARERYLTEMARDIGGGGGGDDASLSRGRALVAEAGRRAGAGELTLHDCFRLALANSERLQMAGERILQADVQKARAIASVLPRVALEGRYTQDSEQVEFGGRAFAPRERAEYWIAARQSLLDGRLWPAIDLAEETRRIEALRLRDERDQLVFAVAATFYELKGLEADIGVLEATKARAAEHLRVLRLKERAGEAQPQDVLALEALHEETEARWMQARNDLDRARARLSRLTGVDPLPPNLRDTYDGEPPSGDLSQLVDRALQERSDLAIARAEVDRARSERALARAAYLPKVDLEFDRWMRREGGFQEDLDWTLGIGLSWNIFDGGAREMDLARTMSLIRERRLGVRSLEKDVKQEVEDSLLAFRSLDVSLRAFESRLSSAAALEERTRREFQAGEATVFDTLLAQEAREDAGRNLLRTRLARKLAALRIRLAVGGLWEVLEEAGE
jgi:outer membrane protein TolC